MRSKDKAVNEKYNPSGVEVIWQKFWEKEKIYSPNLDKAKRPFYNLMMFPYPSAEGMHVGNMYAFTGADVYGRFKRMQGYDVFEPIGLDGFGIHSENYAIKVGRHPKEQAKISERNFYRQLRATGNGFDWSRTVETYNPKYYKWTQWLFIQLFKAGLAYRKRAPVNYCPSCKTVLADEQVITKIRNKNEKIKITEDEKVCERCETEIEKRDLEQWFFRITKYADRLLSNIDKLDWSEKVKISQRQWIGRSEGARIEFKIQNSKFKIEVFTTRPDTLFGATFLVISPEHPIVASLLKGKFEAARSHLARLDEVKDYVWQTRRKTEEERLAEEKEKTGIFTGIYAINPLNQEELPIWIADYAIMGYGTGALFGDAHDERDVKFAKKYKIPLKPTIITGDKDKDKRIRNLEECFTGYGILINSGEFSGLKSEDAKEKVTEWLSKNASGGPKITYHLRDWLISRQRYWGPPIPLVFCENCAVKIKKGEYSKGEKENPGWISVKEKDLPVFLPDVKDWKPLGTGKSPLANHPEFYKTKCPNCKGKAERETDVSDTFLDSSWYFLRYLATEFEDIPFPMEKSKIKNQKSKVIGNWKLEIGNSAHRAAWLPVNMYIGGAEHSVLHLLYSRFITMALKDLGFLSFEEPFRRFFAHGLLIKEGIKMSKSKGNVVIPDSYIKKYGADTLRCYLMFLGPFSQGGDFYDSGIEGMHKFLRRIWTLAQKSISNFQFPISNQSNQMMHKAIKKVTEDIENLHYNTAISQLMIYYNFLSKQKGVSQEEIEAFLKLLSPFAPHLTEELWQRMRPSSSIHTQPWPIFDAKFIAEDETTIAVLVNGKLRGTMLIKSDKLKSKDEIERLAKDTDKVLKYLTGKVVKKVIYVEGKIINFATD